MHLDLFSFHLLRMDGIRYRPRMDYNKFQDISKTGIRAFHNSFTFASSTNSNIMNTNHYTSDPSSTTKGAEDPL